MHKGRLDLVHSQIQIHILQSARTNTHSQSHPNNQNSFPTIEWINKACWYKQHGKWFWSSSNASFVVSNGSVSDFSNGANLLFRGSKAICQSITILWTFLRNYKTETALQTYAVFDFLVQVYWIFYHTYNNKSNVYWVVVWNFHGLKISIEIFRFTIEMSSQLFHFTRNVVLNWVERQNNNNFFFGGRMNRNEDYSVYSIFVWKMRPNWISEQDARTSLRNESSTNSRRFGNCFERKSHAHRQIHTERKEWFVNTNCNFLLIYCNGLCFMCHKCS